MKTVHLTDDELQLFVAEPGAISEALKLHVHSCGSCQVKVANYRLLSLTIQQEPKPKFDFDLRTLVLQQLPEPKHKSSFPWAVVLVSGVSIILIASLWVFFWEPMALIIQGASAVILISAVTAAVTILIFQVLEMVKNYNKRIGILLNANNVQL